MPDHPAGVRGGQSHHVNLWVSLRARFDCMRKSRTDPTLHLIDVHVHDYIQTSNDSCLVYNHLHNAIIGNLTWSVTPDTNTYATLNIATYDTPYYRTFTLRYHVHSWHAGRVGPASNFLNHLQWSLRFHLAPLGRSVAILPNWSPKQCDEYVDQK